MTEDAELADSEATPLYRRIPWRRIASVLAVVVLVVVVLPFVVYAFPQLVGGNQSYVVLSGSMSPTIGPGDVIVVGSVPAADVQVGDVITFRRGGESSPTTHRVVDIVDRDGSVAFRTAGDNNENPDPDLVEPSRLVGKVVSIGGYLLIIPQIGRVIMFSSTQTGFLLLGLVPLSLFVVNELWNVIDATRSDGDPPSEREGQTASSRETDNEDDTIAFSVEELRVGVAVLFAFLAYSIWVAYATVETWALGAVGAVGAAFLLGAGLLVFGGTDGAMMDPSEMEEPQPEQGEAQTVEKPKEMTDLQSVGIDDSKKEADPSAGTPSSPDESTTVEATKNGRSANANRSRGDGDDD
ncbi:signal peptidase I [Halorhabdus rudnickae]|uniref:signal peptidase I n=1 Tax=Halorhabdus rudnickae TaxID=1775544 RepID=UPI001082A716|nr:signal peptidase I [Halorhabdus rudnickae]